MTAAENRFHCQGKSAHYRAGGSAPEEKSVLAAVSPGTTSISDPCCGRLKVSLSQDRRVVRDVAGDDVGERANGEGVVAGDAFAHPGLGRQVSKERQRRHTDDS